MKKVFLVWFTLFVSTIVHAEPVTLVSNNQPAVKIVVAHDKTPTSSPYVTECSTAATALQGYIKQITGVELPIIKETKTSTPITGPTLNIGMTHTTLASDMPEPSSNPETYVIKVRDGNIYFEGLNSIITARAVYSFIEEYLGVRWFAPGEDWTYIPVNSSPGKLTLNVDSINKKPDFSPRLWSGFSDGPEWNTWITRNKVGLSKVPIPWTSFQNNIYKIFKPSKYRASHPEYYPYINGRRKIPSGDNDATWWPCIGNPEVQQITADYIHDYFKANPGAPSFSLGMDDIYRMCQCPLCRAMDEKPDDDKNRLYSNRYYKFINIVAAKVKVTDPGKYIGLLVYSRAHSAPSQVARMEDNVFGYMTQNSSLWYNPTTKATNQKETLSWTSRLSHISRYDYLGFYALSPRYFPENLSEAMKFDKQNGFEGMYTEVKVFLPNSGPMAWVLAKLQWDAQLDINHLLDDYYSKMYGAAANDMKRYFTFLGDCWAVDKPGLTRGLWNSTLQQSLVMTPADVQQAFTLIDMAYANSRLPIEKKRIRIIRDGLQFYSYLPLISKAAQDFNAVTVDSPANAQLALQRARALGDLVSARETFWAEAVAPTRKDILGANLRGMAANSAWPTMPSIENPQIPGLLNLMDWYSQNEPAQAGQVARQIRDYFSVGQIHDVLTAYKWVEDNRPKNMLANGDFHAWGSGGPAGWAFWSRMQTATRVKDTSGGRNNSTGIRMASRTLPGDTGRLMYYFNNLTPGSKYLATGWVKLEPGSDPSGVRFGIRLRKNNAWYTGSEQPRVTQTAANDVPGWQRLFVYVTIPGDATGAAVMLDVSKGEVVYDDIALYQITS